MNLGTVMSMEEASAAVLRESQVDTVKVSTVEASVPLSVDIFDVATTALQDKRKTTALISPKHPSIFSFYVG